jgi:hypothetical protein
MFIEQALNFLMICNNLKVFPNECDTKLKQIKLVITEYVASLRSDFLESYSQALNYNYKNDDKKILEVNLARKYTYLMSMLKLVKDYKLTFYQNDYEDSIVSSLNK